MQDTLPRKPIIITLSVIALILIGYFILQAVIFRITKSSPDTNNYPSSLGTVEFFFNRELDANTINQAFAKDPETVVKPSFDSRTLIEVRKNSILITLSKTPLKGSYSIRLGNITAKGGATLTANVPFIVKNIPYDKLGPEEKKLYDEAANTAESQPDDPITKVLPHETENYKLSYTFPAEQVEQPATIEVTMKFFAPGDEALPATAAQQQEYLNKIRTYRTEALAYLKDKGIDVNRYIMSYTEPELRDEFPAGYTTLATGD